MGVDLRFHQVIRSIPYWYFFIILGISSTIIGPTLILLERNLDNPNAGKAVFVARAVGYCIGSIIAGFLYDIVKFVNTKYEKGLLKWFPKSRVNIFTNFLCLNLNSLKYYHCFFIFLIALGMVLQPYAGNLTSLFLLNFLLSVGQGGGEPGSDVGVAYIWGRDLNAAVFILQCSYGVGTILFPFVMSQIYKIPNVNHLVLSYWVGFIICMSPIFVHLVFPPARYDISQDIETVDTKTQSVEKKKTFTCFQNFYWLIISLFFFFYCGCEMSVGSLIVSFLVEKKMDNPSNASLLNFFFFLFFTLGRFFGIFENFIVPLGYMLFINICSCIVFSTGLYLLADNLWMVRILVCCLGVSMSIIYPSTYAMPKKMFNIEVTGIGTMFSLIGASAAQAAPALFQIVIRRYNNWDLLFLMLIVWFLLCLVILFVELLLGSFCKYVVKKKREKSDSSRKSIIN